VAHIMLGGGRRRSLARSKMRGIFHNFSKKGKGIGQISLNTKRCPKKKRPDVGRKWGGGGREFISKGTVLANRKRRWSTSTSEKEVRAADPGREEKAHRLGLPEKRELSAKEKKKNVNQETKSEEHPRPCREIYPEIAAQKGG